MSRWIFGILEYQFGVKSGISNDATEPLLCRATAWEHEKAVARRSFEIQGSNATDFVGSLPKGNHVAVPDVEQGRDLSNRQLLSLHPAYHRQFEVSREVLALRPEPHARGTVNPIGAAQMRSESGSTPWRRATSRYP